jgi:DNA ligase 1
VRLAELVATASTVAATRSRRAKVTALSGLLRRLEPAQVALGAAFLAGEPRQPRLDVGWATLAAVTPPPASQATLSLSDVDALLARLAAVGGPGSKAARAALLDELFAAATADEQRWLRRLLLGELRQGALAGVLAQAIAATWDVPEGAVRRAAMLSGDLAGVARSARDGGRDALDAYRLRLFVPLQPMLAGSAASVADALGQLGRAFVEDKLDGARVQAHRDGRQVRVYTRNLRDVTARSPEVVAAVAGLPARRLVLDGEVLALRPDGIPEPFQDTMRRFGSERTAPRRAGALVPFFFDCLHLDGVDLLDQPLATRRSALRRVVPSHQVVASRLVDDPGEAADLLAQALRRGHEGVLVKDADSRYEAGRRGAAWRKVKPVHTLDLVVLAAEWGSGRRRGWLSNLHLGARDPAGGFVMLGKTFKGLTDELLTWQTARLLELETARDRHVVHVRPELVVEVAFDGVQTSSRYPGGVALRFARVRRYREDKPPAQADTVDIVRALAERPSGAS